MPPRPPKNDHGSRPPPLPEHLATDPSLLDWRLTRVESEVEALRTEMERRPSLPSLPEDFPWLRLAALLLLAIAGLKGLIAPDMAVQLAGKLFGIGSGP